MRDDGLLLELKLLEGVGLEHLLGACSWLVSRLCTLTLHVCGGPIRTGVEELERAQGDAQQQGVGSPFPLHDGRSQDEQADGYVYPVEVLAREQRVGHCVRSAVSLSLSSLLLLLPSSGPGVWLSRELAGWLAMEDRRGRSCPVGGRALPQLIKEGVDTQRRRGRNGVGAGMGRFSCGLDRNLPVGPGAPPILAAEWP